MDEKVIDTLNQPWAYSCRKYFSNLPPTPPPPSKKRKTQKHNNVETTPQKPVLCAHKYANIQFKLFAMN